MTIMWAVSGRHRSSWGPGGSAPSCSLLSESLSGSAALGWGSGGSAPCSLLFELLFESVRSSWGPGGSVAPCSLLFESLSGSAALGWGPGALMLPGATAMRAPPSLALPRSAASAGVPSATVSAAVLPAVASGARWLAVSGSGGPPVASSRARASAERWATVGRWVDGRSLSVRHMRWIMRVRLRWIRSPVSGSNFARRFHMPSY